MQELTDTTKLQGILDNTENLLIILGADWCDNCTRLKHKLIQFGKSSVQMYYINLDKHQEFVDDYEVKKIPVLLGFKQGVLTFTSQGSQVDVEQLMNNF